MTVFVVCWNIPKYFELQTCYLSDLANETQPISNFSSSNLSRNTPEKEEEFPQVCATELRSSYTYCRDYLLIANFLVMVLIPFLLLVILNSLTLHRIRRSSMNNTNTTKRQRRDQRIARVFIIIIIVFFICNTPRIILNTWEVSCYLSI